MALDFEKYDYELFQDWQENPIKHSFIYELENRAEEEKQVLPKLLSNGDLRKRWNMENRQSVHNIVRRKQFPDPIVVFSVPQPTVIKISANKRHIVLNVLDIQSPLHS